MEVLLGTPLQLGRRQEFACLLTEPYTYRILKRS